MSEVKSSSRWLGIPFTLAGVGSTLVALASLADMVVFRARATERADAIIVENRRAGSLDYYDILEFSASGKPIRVESRGPFAIRWVWNNGRAGGGQSAHTLGSKVAVLYAPNDPEDARLAAFAPQYVMPIISALLGLLFTPLGILVFYRGLKLSSRP